MRTATQYQLAIDQRRRDDAMRERDAAAEEVKRPGAPGGRLSVTLT